MILTMPYWGPESVERAQEKVTKPGQGIRKTSLRRWPFSWEVKGKEELTKGRKVGKTFKAESSAWSPPGQAWRRLENRPVYIKLCERAGPWL